MASVGQKLGRYELVTPIDGPRWLARQQGVDKLVEIRILTGANAAFQLEHAREVAQLDHPNLARVLDLGEDNRTCFVVTEILDGETLAAIAIADAAGKRIDELSLARVIADAAEGIDATAALGGGSVSPATIGVTFAGQVKVSALDATAGSTDGAPNALAYTAPERLDGGAGDPRSDVYSLGVVLWEALTRERLYPADTADATRELIRLREVESPSVFNANIPEPLAEVCMTALARDPADRFATPKQLAVELESVLTQAGYSRRNDQIAAFVGDAFADKRAARKKRGTQPPSGTIPPPLASSTPASPASLMQTMMMPALTVTPAKPATIPPATVPVLPPKPTTIPPPVALPGLTKPTTIPPATIAASISASAAAAVPAPAPKPTTIPPVNVPAAPVVPAAKPTTIPPATAAAADAPSVPRTRTQTRPPMNGSNGAHSPTMPMPALTPAKLPEPRKTAATTPPIADVAATTPFERSEPVVMSPEPTLLASAAEPEPAPPAAAAGAAVTVATAAAAANIVVEREHAEAADPVAVVSLPERPSSDVIGGWGWKTDSQPAITDGETYEEYDEPPPSARKPLFYAIGGAVALVLVIGVIALASGGGGGDDKQKSVAAKPASLGGAPAPTPDAAAPVEPTPTPVAQVEIDAAAAPAPVEIDAAPAPPVAVPAPVAVIDAPPPPVAIAPPPIDAARPAPIVPPDAATPAIAITPPPTPKPEPPKPPHVPKPDHVSDHASDHQVAHADPPKPDHKKPTKPKDDPKPVDPYKETVNVAAAYRTGLQQFARGDTSGALQTLRASLAADPSYAPTWRGLGIIFEKLGERDQARAAFKRYLTLAPGADDADQIMARLERLGA